MSDPTPAIIERCKAWLQVADTLEHYLKTAAQRYDWISEATTRVSREMPQPDDLGDQFAPVGSGGIKDLFKKLWWELNMPDGKCADDASQVIKSQLLKQLESLKKSLQSYITELSEHPLSHESLLSSKAVDQHDPKLDSRISKYVSSISDAESGKQPDVDPFLLKLSLDSRITAAASQHNSGADTYTLVQDAAKKMDSDVVERLQDILRQYTDIAERNGNIIAEGARSVRSVFVRQPKLSEYKHWLQSSVAPQTFVGSNVEPVRTQKTNDSFTYPKYDSFYAKAIRTGPLERRTRILKNYTVGEYVLTPLSLIELRQNEPVWSLDLLDATLLENHKNSTDNQFVIEAKQHGSTSNKKPIWVFRAQVAANWKRDILAVTQGAIPPTLASYGQSKMISSSENASLLDVKSNKANVDVPVSIKSADEGLYDGKAFKEKPKTITTPVAIPTNSVPAAKGPVAPVILSQTSGQEPTLIESTERTSQVYKVSGITGYGPVATGQNNEPEHNQSSTEEHTSKHEKVWSYDDEHKDQGNTLAKEENFRPAESDVPVGKERGFSNTDHKHEQSVLNVTTDGEDAEVPEIAVQNRKDAANVDAFKHKSSRKPTGSFGQAEAPEKLFNSLSTEQKTAALEAKSGLVVED